MSFKVRSFNEWTTDVFDEKTISNVINLKKHDQNQYLALGECPPTPRPG